MTITIFEDEDLIVAHKPSGIDAQHTQKLFQELTVFPINRLDQRVSGIMLFAKNKTTQAKLSTDFSTRKVTKLYKAMVANMPEKAEDKLEHWLLKDAKTNKMKAFSKDVAHSQHAELSYKWLASSQKYHLLEISLLTGRFHQIRAQLSAIGSPIVGDVKYGYKRTTADGSVFLQSYYLAFTHPTTKELMSYTIEQPEHWAKYGF